MKCELSLEENFYGAATVGERGQVVIPSEARKKFGIHPGEKVLVMGHPGGAGIILCKIDSMREFLASFLDDLSKIAANVHNSGEEPEGE